MSEIFLKGRKPQIKEKKKESYWHNIGQQIQNTIILGSYQM